MRAPDFDFDTAVTPVGDGAFEAAIAPHWFIARGPNGGLVAALVLRAMQEALGETSRVARSLTVHYLRPPREGPARIETAVERRGTSVATLTARMLQDGRPVALAIGAFSIPWPGPEYKGVQMPEVRPPESVEPLDDARFPEFMANYDMRWVLGPPPFSGAGEALAGGWVRTAAPRVADALFVAAAADSFPPPIFATLTRPAAAPTIDLTVHFRDVLPPAGAAPEEHVLAVFRTKLAHGGFFDEEGEIWSRDGRLLAQSRQHALLLANRPGR